MMLESRDHDLVARCAHFFQVKFPPNIYYKIFTRRPVIDLCASSPRDYTAMAYRQQLARDRHNKQPRIPAGNGTARINVLLYNL